RYAPAIAGPHRPSYHLLWVPMPHTTNPPIAGPNASAATSALLSPPAAFAPAISASSPTNMAPDAASICPAPRRPSSPGAASTGPGLDANSGAFADSRPGGGAGAAGGGAG